MNRPRLKNSSIAKASWEHDSAVQPQTSRSSRTRIDAPITLFAIPKPFAGQTGIIQRNAIKSWLQLSPAVEVILVGDEPGIAELAAEFDILHISQVQRNEKGTPLVNSAFDAARAASDSPVLVYCNSDVILLREFPAAIEQLMNSQLDQFLAIGRRTDLQVEQEIDFGSKVDQSRLRHRVGREGRVSPVVCKEYFAFSRNLFANIPPFAVGRGNWDNWMVAHARDLRVPVVNLTQAVPAIHQKHGYQQTSQRSRLSCYVFGDEARENQKLGGGRNLIRGSSSTWRMTPDGPRKNRFGWLNTDFWGDSFRFLGLMLDLLSYRR